MGCGGPVEQELSEMVSYGLLDQIEVKNLWTYQIQTCNKISWTTVSTEEEKKHLFSCLIQLFFSVEGLSLVMETFMNVF